MLLENISVFISFIIIGFISIWLFFAYYTYKLSSGIKKALGPEYHLLPNKWPGIDNPDTREAIKRSPELIKYRNIKIKLFISLLSYILLVVVPFMGISYYYAN